MIHRGGLSETILLFTQHHIFLPELNIEQLIARAQMNSLENAAEFAATGVDILVTSSLYSAKPADYGAVMKRA